MPGARSTAVDSTGALLRASRRANSAQSLREAPSGRVLPIPVTPLEISATQVRALLASGREPRWLVPDALFADPALLASYRLPRTGWP